MFLVKIKEMKLKMPYIITTASILYHKAKQFHSIYNQKRKLYRNDILHIKTVSKDYCRAINVELIPC